MRVYGTPVTPHPSYNCQRLNLLSIYARLQSVVNSIFHSPVPLRPTIFVTIYLCYDVAWLILLDLWGGLLFMERPGGYYRK